MPRYDDQQDYGRARGEPARGNDMARDTRTTRIERTDRRPGSDGRGDYHMDDAMDMRMEIRPEPRAANTGTRMERPPPRGIDPQRDVLYRDPRTGELYRDVPSRRTPYEDEFPDMQPSNRPIVVSLPEPGQTRASYAEYFLPGEGIEREVIQAEICRYLGPDALCRPGKNPTDGRPGFIIKAYRALTTEMIRSLQESSAKMRNEEKYWADKDKRRRRPEVSYTPIQDHQYDQQMDMGDDDHSFAQLNRYGHSDLDPRDPRAQTNTRYIPPVTTGYMTEPGYPAYSISSAQSSVPQMGYEPRSFVPAGNTTPPTGLRATAFPASNFPARTTQPSTASMPAPYMDPRTGKMVESYSTYSTDTRRHPR